VGCGDAEMLEHIQRVKTPAYAVGIDFREGLIKHDAINIYVEMQKTYHLRIKVLTA